MRRIFSDTFYFVALLNPKDQWYASAKRIKAELGEIRLVVTGSVLIELLNYFSEYGAEIRQTTVAVVRDLMIDLDVEFIPHTPEIFLDALAFYEPRPDKGYSLTDCISMVTMRGQNLREILTHDKHFEQEGFALLL